jgi:hypothetical protein
MVGLAVVLVVVAGAARATAAPAEPCTDLKLAQAQSVLGPSAKLSEKKVVRERVCTVKVGGSVAATVRSEFGGDYDYVVTGLKNEKAYVKQLKPASIGKGGYSYDLYAGAPPSFSQRVLLFRAKSRMFSVEVPARRLLTAQKHLALARLVVRNAR